MTAIISLLLIVAAAAAASASAEAPADGIGHEDHVHVDKDEGDALDHVPSSSDRSSAVFTALPREEKLTLLEYDHGEIVTKKVLPAEAAARANRISLDTFKKNLGYFPSAAEKTHLTFLEARVETAEEKLEVLILEANKIVDQIKPLHGLMSTVFLEEQRQTVVYAMERAHEAGSRQALYSAMFKAFDAENGVAEVVIGILIEYVMGVLIIYGTYFLGYVFYTGPQSIAAYSRDSNYVDYAWGIIVYVFCVFIFALPVIVLFVGFKVAGKFIRESREQKEADMRAKAEAEAEAEAKKLAITQGSKDNS